MIAVHPDRDQDIGIVGLHDEVVVSRRFTASGYAFEVAVTSRMQDQQQSGSQADMRG